MLASRVAHVIAQLIFLLIPKNRKRGNRGDKLLISESLKPGDRAGEGAERKCQGETQIGIASLGEGKYTGAENERANPRRDERRLMERHRPVIAVIRSRP